MKNIGILIAFLFMLPHPHALASDLESKLYQSCLLGTKSSEIDKNMCACQAQKWASKKVESFDKPTTYLDIDDRFLDKLVEDGHQFKAGQY